LDKMAGILWIPGQNSRFFCRRQTCDKGFEKPVCMGVGGQILFRNRQSTGLSFSIRFPDHRNWNPSIRATFKIANAMLGRFLIIYYNRRHIVYLEKKCGEFTNTNLWTRTQSGENLFPAVKALGLFLCLAGCRNIHRLARRVKNNEIKSTVILFTL